MPPVGPNWAARIGFIFLSLLCATQLDSQLVRVSDNLRVTGGLEQRSFFEPHLAVHPAQPNHLLAAAIVAETNESWLKTVTCWSFLSVDAGKTWERHSFPVTPCADPWVAITPEGHAVLAVAGAGGELIIFHSKDGGRTWNDSPVRLGRGHDHPTVAVDTASPRRKGWLYVVSGKGTRAEEGQLRWSVFIARSRNGGETFDDPITVVPSNLNINAEIPAVLSDGTLVASFVDFQRNADGFRKSGLLDRRRQWMLRSADGGYTFSVPLFATEACASAWSALTADPTSGPFADRLYLACEQKGGGAIVIHSSSDRGETWTDPAVVHSAAAETAILRETPALAVNKHGVLGVAWIDGRSQPGKCHEVFFAASTDGGRTFLPERRVSSVRSCPDVAGFGGPYKRWPSGGDYFAMTAASDGRFHLLWPDAREKVFRLWTAAVEVQGAAADHK